MGFRIKKIVAFFLNLFGILDILIRLQYRNLHNQYIRIINYHNNSRTGVENFDKQLRWLKNHYVNVDYKIFTDIVENNVTQFTDKPGIMLTFDDGLEGNFLYGRDIMNKNGMTGYYLVSADLIGKKGYMNETQIRRMLEDGHIIGCHTSTHHRMDKNDSVKTLEYEIKDAKYKLEKAFGREIEIFCWCGGEESTYTTEAANMIRVAGYKFGFMTNSYPLTIKTERYHIQRINVEDDWPIYLMKFQLSGIMDLKLKRKRNRVDKITD